MLLHQDLLGEGNEITALFSGLGGHNNLAVTALHLAHGHLTVDFGNHSGVRGVTGFEELGHTGKTTGDITTLHSGTRNLHKRLTRLHCLAVFNHDVSTHREVIGSDLLSLGVDNITGGHLRLILRFGDNLLGQTGCFVGFGTEGNTLHHVVELECTTVFGHDYCVEGVPLGNLVTLLHHVASLEIERRTVRYVHRREYNLRVGVNETDLTQTAHNHLALVAILIERHRSQLLKLEHTVVLGNDRGIGGCVGSHTTGVERTERQLGTGLTNGLCGNHTHSLTLLHHAAGSQVAAVTLHADTMLALAGKHRTDFDTLDGRVFDNLADGFCNLLTGSHNQISGRRMDNIMYGNTSEDSF